jgi:hypothetical protein
MPYFVSFARTCTLPHRLILKNILRLLFLFCVIKIYTLTNQAASGFDDIQWEKDEDKVNLSLLVVPLGLVAFVFVLAIALVAIVAYKVRASSLLHSSGVIYQYSNSNSLTFTPTPPHTRTHNPLYCIASYHIISYHYPVLLRQERPWRMACGRGGSLYACRRDGRCHNHQFWGPSGRCCLQHRISRL